MNLAVAAPLQIASQPWDATLGGVDVRFGHGRLNDLGAIAEQMQTTRALLVTDAGLMTAGHAAAAVASLETAGLTVTVFDAVEENPSTASIESAVRFVRDEQKRSGPIELIVGLGGGSALDTAKGVNFVLTNGGRMADYWGYGKAKRPMLPMIGIPTTAGTGSDSQSYALISRSEEPDAGRKMACGDPGARFRTVLLDPDLLLTAPQQVIALAGLDALSHAVESLVTRRKTPISTMLAREAFQRLDLALPAALDGQAGDSERADLLLGAHLAGAAIEASMLGAAHAAANPLTARFGVPHGAAVALMLPHVVRFNAADPDRTETESLYRQIFPAGAEALAVRIETLRRAGRLPTTLGAAGVDLGCLSDLAEMATKEWTGGFNPRPLTDRDFRRLYDAAS